MNRPKRCYYQISEFEAVQAPFVMTPGGELKNYPITNNQTVSMKKVKGQYPTINEGQNLNMGGGLIPARGGADLVPGETPSGGREAFRAEGPGLSDANTSELSITFDNSAGGAVDEVVAIGDGVGLIGDALGLTPPAATLTVSSQNYADPLLVLKDIALGSGLDLHRLHVTADDSAFYASGYIKPSIANADGTGVREQQIFLNMSVTGDTFNPLIREERNFRFALGTFSGIVVKIPAGRVVTLSFKIAAYAAGRLMKKGGAA